MAAGLRAILRSGVVTFIVLGAGAVFVILGIAGVSLRANCLEAGVCVDGIDVAATGSIAAVAEPEASPQFVAAAEPMTRETRLKSAGGLIAATFDTLNVEPDGADAPAAEVPTTVAAASSEPAGPDDAPPALARRVVKAVDVTADGQPIWTSPPGGAVAVADRPDNAALVAAREVSGGEPIPEIEPLAFSARAPAVAENGAPVPRPRPASLQVAAVEAPEATEPAPAATGDRRIVTGQGVNVRSGPSSSQGKLFALKGGAEVTVTSKERGWLQISDDQGRTGWVYQNYLKPAG